MITNCCQKNLINTRIIETKEWIYASHCLFHCNREKKVFSYGDTCTLSVYPLWVQPWHFLVKRATLLPAVSQSLRQAEKCCSWTLYQTVLVFSAVCIQGHTSVAGITEWPPSKVFAQQLKSSRDLFIVVVIQDLIFILFITGTYIALYIYSKL